MERRTVVTSCASAKYRATGAKTRQQAAAIAMWQHAAMPAADQFRQPDHDSDGQRQAADDRNEQPDQGRDRKRLREDDGPCRLARRFFARAHLRPPPDDLRRRNARLPLRVLELTANLLRKRDERPALGALGLVALTVAEAS